MFCHSLGEVNRSSTYDGYVVHKNREGFFLHGFLFITAFYTHSHQDILFVEKGFKNEKLKPHFCKLIKEMRF